FLLQVVLGVLVILIGELPHAIFELQVAQVFVDRRFTLVEVGEGRDGFGWRDVFGTDAQDKRDDGDREDACQHDNHSRFARSFSIWSLYFSSAGSSSSRGPISASGFGFRYFLRNSQMITSPAPTEA